MVSNDRTCQVCGALLDDAGEFHPALFCAIKRTYPTHRPWDIFAMSVKSLGVNVPDDPPLIRDLPLRREAE